MNGQKQDKPIDPLRKKHGNKQPAKDGLLLHLLSRVHSHEVLVDGDGRVHPMVTFGHLSKVGSGILKRDKEKRFRKTLKIMKNGKFVKEEL